MAGRKRSIDSAFEGGATSSKRQRLEERATTISRARGRGRGRGGRGRGQITSTRGCYRTGSNHPTLGVLTIPHEGKSHTESTLEDEVQQLEPSARQTKGDLPHEPSAFQTETKVPRIVTSHHSSCSELSLSFVSDYGVETDAATNTIALNLMDYFVFSEEHWLPELSFFKLHAACFYVASMVTGKQNKASDVANSLGRDAPLVCTIAELAGEDEYSTAALCDMISVSSEDVEHCYSLLYERREHLAGLMGEYAGNVAKLPVPGVPPPPVEVEEEDFDQFEE